MSKKRISLTLERELVEKVDLEAEDKGLNRSSMVEQIVESHFKRKGVGTAAVLCGGAESKTLELVEGKPVLSHILDHLRSQGINRTILLVGRNREIENQFGSEYRGIALEYVFEDEPEGTASALSKIESKVNEDLVVLNGHVAADVDIRDMLKVHEDEDAVATMALTTVENPSNYGVARLKGREILGFEEKPSKGEEPSRLINSGTYIVSPSIFSRLNGSNLESVFESLAATSELYGYIYGGKWLEVG